MRRIDLVRPGPGPVRFAHWASVMQSDLWAQAGMQQRQLQRVKLQALASLSRERQQVQVQVQVSGQARGPQQGMVPAPSKSPPRAVRAAAQADSAVQAHHPADRTSRSPGAMPGWISDFFFPPGRRPA